MSSNETRDLLDKMFHIKLKDINPTEYEQIFQKAIAEHLKLDYSEGSKDDTYKCVVKSIEFDGDKTEMKIEFNRLHNFNN